MATATACAALVPVLPHLARARRRLIGAASLPGTATLSIVREHGSLRMSEVAEGLGLDLSTVSRHVAHLRAEGLLTTSPDPDDGRSQRLAVTAAGEAELRAQRDRVVGALVARLAGWDDAEVDDLARLLRKLAATTAPEKTLQRNA
ncbi:MarR family transcriptional regulator [Paenibacillus sp. TRM 82003]|uniref:MarR family winged helix-turn-helix transcriptional regulator n=1 Tax=Kineococcus sp. TRM81007 TaxID=2925831 RepID=UPI001F596FD4|nr:MarR family transcriptional regulator [Kineococcus sp. TRM81007]MCI2240037.1 MarR family transcriptional regulator [Kineococcus sp. TRM81007]MCI3925657.1 MarR family transcriptional regulator [Paenibacillus sp. TRM 82003]